MIFSAKKEDTKPLVIPLIANTKTSSALAALKSLKNTLDGVEEDVVIVENELKPIVIDISGADTITLEEKAAAEILNSLVEKQNLENTDNGLVLPLTADELPLDGAAESTIDDYENIPIANFGLAMLRGMGWKDEENKKKTDAKIDGPTLRPKGMGLGADKMIKAKPLLVEPARGEVLAIQKSASVRVLSGKHKDLYGQVSVKHLFIFF